MSLISRTTSNYRPTEVRNYIESWEAMKEKRGTQPEHPLRLLLNMMDVERELARLPLKERQALLLVGRAGLTHRNAGLLVGIDPSAMHRRYLSGLERLTTYLNGAYVRA